MWQYGHVKNVLYMRALKRFQEMQEVGKRKRTMRLEGTYRGKYLS